MEHDEVVSPTISTEGTLLTPVIEVQEGQDIATCNIPNTFVQTHLEEQDKKSDHHENKGSLCGHPLRN